MKKIIAFFCALLMLALTACKEPPEVEITTSTEQIPQAVTTLPADTGEEVPEIKESVDTMEKLAEVDGVLSVTQLEFSTPMPNAVAYKLLYQTENGKLHADVVLPADYADPNKQYTVLLYFPDVGIGIEGLASDYAMNDIIVIRPYRRGSGESEGVRDFGGSKDLFDAQALLRIVDSATFIQNKKLYVAGAVEYSVLALRLVAEDSVHRINGCVVINPITDLSSFAASRENLQAFCTALIGKSYDEAPEEYAFRSAVEFASRLDRPILLLYYAQNMVVPQEQATDLYDLLAPYKQCTYQELEGRFSDFTGETAYQWFFSWINEQNQKQAYKIEEDGSYFIVQTEWMTFYFSKKEYPRTIVLDIVTEAVSVMSDIRAFLGVNYTLENAEGAKCYFDNTIEYNGERLSYFDTNQDMIMCQGISVITHEYAHMVSMSSLDYLYRPSTYFIEGLAMYVGMNFPYNIASREYRFFSNTGFNAKEPSQIIYNLLQENKMEITAMNYKKAYVAWWCTQNDISKIDPKDDFYEYDIGSVFVDYCINQLGGVNKFMSAFNDSVRFSNVYGKSAEEVLEDALAYNMSLFYPNT